MPMIMNILCGSEYDDNEKSVNITLAQFILNNI